MSSRALRKLQREQAEKEIQKQVAAAEAEQQEDESEEEEEEPVAISQPRNAFDMLDGFEDTEASEPDNDVDTQTDVKESPADSTPKPPVSKSKKKKKKQKKKVKDKADALPERDMSGDEIDRALKELAATGDNTSQHGEAVIASWEATATKLLAINQKNLNSVNEMRSLFGNIALENHDSPTPPRSQRQRDINLQGGVDVATALTGRYSVASRGKELGILADRRNVLMQGKKEWPLATSGGLSMETVDGQGFEKQFNVMHNQQYQETQMHFRLAVESMQAERMIGLLVTHPYHIATLLQVSEIMKHQGDHSVSGDLLERALFNFGRSVHSLFPAAVREGVARLNFDKPANRELYLTIWRYIRNLEMRGTWRTAFEWAKMLLQLNTLSDPYGMTLVIDQLALRGRQHTQLLELVSENGYGSAWAHLPNIQISLALAYLREKQPREARKQLAYAMHHYPYILSALASALEIQPMPKSLWGKQPSSEAEKLYTELYVTRARDLWNTPETTALIDEVANTLSHYEAFVTPQDAPPKLQISLEEARHIMLLEIPSLIALLPRKFTNMSTSSSDVLPPPSSMSDFTARAPNAATHGDVLGPNSMQALFNAAGTAASAPIVGANGLLQRILGWFHAPAGPNDTANELGESEGQAAFRAMREQLGGEGIPDEVVEDMIRVHLDSGADNNFIDPEDLGLAPGQALPGDWDHYEDLVNADSDTDSMPELEGSPSATETASSQPRNPRAAMVEEADEDEEQTGGFGSRITVGRAVLRHADSDDEDEVEVEDASHRGLSARVNSSTRPSGTLPTQSSHQPLSSPPPSSSATASTTTDPGPGGDPQRIQRYLLTTGLDLLQSDPTTLPAYALRLKVLRKQQQDWLVGIVRQRAGKALADRVQAAL